MGLQLCVRVVHEVEISSVCLSCGMLIIKVHSHV